MSDSPSSRGRRARLALGLAALALVAAIAVLLARPAPPSTGAVVDQGGGADPAGRESARAPQGAPLRGPPAMAQPEEVDPARASLAGHVRSSENGVGIAGVELTFSRGGGAAGVRSGRDGAFRFEPPAEGTWRLAAATAPGFFPFAPEWEQSPVAFEARAGHALGGIEIELTPARPLRGTVLDPGGAPVPGAEVRLLGALGEAALHALEDRFTSDAAGDVRVAAPPGAWVEARKDGFAPGRVEIDLAVRAAGRFSISLRPGPGPDQAPAPISGRVVERGAGAAIAGALVVAQREGRFGGTGPVAGQALSGADGAFVLGPLAGGRFRLTARAGGRAPASASRIAPGSGGVTLELSPGARLRGCVRDASSGGPVTAFTVLIFERKGALWRSPALSRSFFDAAGCWEIADLAPGPVAVVVAAPGYAPSTELAADAPDAGEGTADAALDPEGRLSGIVLDEATRAPLAGARVALEDALPEAASVFPVAREAVTDADGRFAVRGLPRRYSLAVAAAGHHLRVVSGEALPGVDSGPVEIVLAPVREGEEPRVELTGIGVSVAPRGEVLVVTGVQPAGGAAEAGLVRGDAIVAVDGVPVTVLGFGRALDAIRGPEGSFVLLQVRRGETTREVRVGRRIVRG